MTGITTANDFDMVNSSRYPCPKNMTGLAGIRRLKMQGRFSARDAIVMTGDTVSCYALMIKNILRPRSVRRMTLITLHRRDDMYWPFANCNDIVVTTAAGANGL